MNKSVRIGVIMLLVISLFLIRALSQHFFYDPLQEYFSREYLYASVPEIHYEIFFLFLFFRYFLNALISISIIHVVFLNKNWTTFSVKFYLLAFIVLSLLLFILLKLDIYDGYLLLFYIRRFLIHPVFILILLPAFYYQKLKS